ncbi:hypothetical protein C8R45DRAFT_935084 [Mycena sanguinolenta]|nr:hypothetical protein C8R45DRAFT_935084 [Mycena sanguinolenta]
MPLPAWGGAKEVTWLDRSCSLPASPPRVEAFVGSGESWAGKRNALPPSPSASPPSLSWAKKLTVSQRKRAYHHGESGVVQHAHENGNGDTAKEPLRRQRRMRSGLAEATTRVWSAWESRRKIPCLICAADDLGSGGRAGPGACAGGVVSCRVEAPRGDGLRGRARRSRSVRRSLVRQVGSRGRMRPTQGCGAGRHVTSGIGSCRFAGWSGLAFVGEENNTDGSVGGRPRSAGVGAACPALPLPRSPSIVHCADGGCERASASRLLLVSSELSRAMPFALRLRAGRAAQDEVLPVPRDRQSAAVGSGCVRVQLRRKGKARRWDATQCVDCLDALMRQAVDGGLHLQYPRSARSPMTATTLGVWREAASLLSSFIASHLLRHYSPLLRLLPTLSQYYPHTPPRAPRPHATSPACAREAGYWTALVSEEAGKRENAKGGERRQRVARRMDGGEAGDERRMESRGGGMDGRTRIALDGLAI